jgi:hypothetical protein
VSIEIEWMGVGMIGILTDGNEDTVGVPQIEGLVERGIYGVGPIVLREGNVDITGMTLVPLVKGIESLAILDETPSLDMVGGFLNKEKGSLKISLT